MERIGVTAAPVPTVGLTADDNNSNHQTGKCSGALSFTVSSFSPAEVNVLVQTQRNAELLRNQRRSEIHTQHLVPDLKSSLQVSF